MKMISDRLTDEQLAEILSGVVDGMEPTTQELAMAAELQERRKADSAEPVAVINGAREPVLYGEHIGIAIGTHLYVAPPAPVVPEGLRMALSNAGIAAPESDEMLAATHEKYIQMLVTWIKDHKPFQPVPETLPCPVHLEPGLKFGKGVRTQYVLDALLRRADYCAVLDAMTQEQKAEHDAGIAEFKAMLGNDSRAAMLQDDDSPVATDCWVMVPAKATIAMISAGGKAAREYLEDYGGNSPQVIYQAMLAAAPQPEGR